MIEFSLSLTKYRLYGLRQNPAGRKSVSNISTLYAGLIKVLLRYQYDAEYVAQLFS